MHAIASLTIQYGGIVHSFMESGSNDLGKLIATMLRS
jgi:hypothetical protein